MSRLSMQGIDAVIERESGMKTPARVGLDLGAHETRVALSGREDDTVSVFTMPTILGYSRPQAEPIRFSCVGDQALDRRDHLRLVNPFDVNPSEDDGKTLGDFAGHLRQVFARRYNSKPWGVVNCSVGATEQEVNIKRAIANELFERVVFVDDSFLLALGIASLEVSSHSVLVDVGTRSIRAALMYGETPKPEERLEVLYGGARVDDTLRQMISLRYPELLLTPRTLSQIKHRLSFVAPSNRNALLEISYRGSTKTIDFSTVIQDACSRLVRPLLKGIRAVLARCPSDEIEAFQRNILVVGGGAEIPGMPERLEAELRADGFEFATVRKPADATQLVARGAGRWAQMLEEEEFAIPLFSFGGKN